MRDVSPVRHILKTNAPLVAFSLISWILKDFLVHLQLQLSSQSANDNRTSASVQALRSAEERGAGLAKTTGEKRCLWAPITELSDNLSSHSGISGVMQVTAARQRPAGKTARVRKKLAIANVCYPWLQYFELPANPTSKSIKQLSCPALVKHNSSLRADDPLAFSLTQTLRYKKATGYYFFNMLMLTHSPGIVKKLSLLCLMAYVTMKECRGKLHLLVRQNLLSALPLQVCPNALGSSSVESLWIDTS